MTIFRIGAFLRVTAVLLGGPAVPEPAEREPTAERSTTGTPIVVNLYTHGPIMIEDITHE
jgi:hypothetical protein